MPGPMVEIKPRAPKRLPRQRVDLRAARGHRKDGARDRDMALEPRVNRSRMRLLGPADSDRAGDVGSAVLICAPLSTRKMPRSIFGWTTR